MILIVYLFYFRCSDFVVFQMVLLIPTIYFWFFYRSSKNTRKIKLTALDNNTTSKIFNKRKTNKSIVYRFSLSILLYPREKVFFIVSIQTFFIIFTEKHPRLSERDIQGLLSKKTILSRFWVKSRKKTFFLKVGKMSHS